MGGWASYKLAFEHPDDFAGALSLDGPVICGVQAYPGLNGPAYSDPACSQDGQSQPLIANARWIPYVIDQTYADELVPTTGVIAQAQGFDQLGQRYNLFIHTGADHLEFATEDRFGDVVSALGSPVRTTNPGVFTYRWYPSLNSSQLGIGATGDYWLSGLSRARWRLRDPGHHSRRRQRAARSGHHRPAFRAPPGHATAAGNQLRSELGARSPARGQTHHGPRSE